MKIAFYCPRWGSEDIPWKEFCARVAEAGYSGIEAPIPQTEKSRAEIREALDQYELLLIGQYYQSFEKDFEIHKLNFKAHLENIASMDCVLINSQTGKDYYTPEQNVELFKIAQDFSAKCGIGIVHETHRNKALYAAHRFKELNQRFPALEITADFSHWCCVSESLLEQQAETMDIAISKAIHIHARVGYAQSPQVPDPRMIAYQDAFLAHIGWWDAIVAFREKSGYTGLSVTPEFGPVPYMQTIPHTNMPVANQWELNLYMMNYLRERYKY